MVEIGTLPSGGKCIINRKAIETDLLIAEGFIEPPLFCRLLRRQKIGTAWSSFQDHSSGQPLFRLHRQFRRARTGVLEGNPIHQDMIYAAETAGLAFILNVVLDEDKRIVHAVGGSF